MNVRIEKRPLVVIISAARDTYHEKTNEFLTVALCDKLTNYGMDFKRVQGMWNGKSEPSVLVAIDPKDPRAKTLLFYLYSLAKLYQQDAILLRVPEEQAEEVYEGSGVFLISNFRLVCVPGQQDTMDADIERIGDDLEPVAVCPTEGGATIVDGRCYVAR